MARTYVMDGAINVSGNPLCTTRPVSTAPGTEHVNRPAGGSGHVRTRPRVRSRIGPRHPPTVEECAAVSSPTEPERAGLHRRAERPMARQTAIFRWSAASGLYSRRVDPSLRPRADTLARLSLAKDYPYDIPQSSFAFLAGRTLPLVSVDLQSPLDSQVRDEGRVRTLRACAVGSGVSSVHLEAPSMLLLAYGANASPEVLSRKLSSWKEIAALPVARATLQDFDAVYSSHISPYG